MNKIFRLLFVSIREKALYYTFYIYIKSFIHSFIHLFIYLCIYLFIYSECPILNLDRMNSSVKGNIGFGIESE